VKKESKEERKKGKGKDKRLFGLEREKKYIYISFSLF
jgi:hypothetical protein